VDPCSLGPTFRVGPFFIDLTTPLPKPCAPPATSAGARRSALDTSSSGSEVQEGKGKGLFYLTDSTQMDRFVLDAKLASYSLMAKALLP
jgi:hypothetical protein